MESESSRGKVPWDWPIPALDDDIDTTRFVSLSQQRASREMGDQRTDSPDDDSG